jgi:hypothetical protein
VFVYIIPLLYILELISGCKFISISSSQNTCHDMIDILLSFTGVAAGHGTLIKKVALNFLHLLFEQQFLQVAILFGFDKQETLGCQPKPK